MTARPLSSAALASRVQALVAEEGAVPAGAHGAIVTVVNQDLVEVTLALKTPHGWTVEVVAQHEWKGAQAVHATVTKTW
jgi:hypothetical protein